MNLFLQCNQPSILPSKENQSFGGQVDFVSLQCTFPHYIFGKATLPVLKLNLVPWDFLMFPKLIISLERRHFESREDVQNDMTAILKDVQQCFEAW